MPENSQPNFLELYRSIGRIEEAVKNIDTKLDKSIKESCDRICDCEIKIEKHEMELSNAKGKASIIGGIVGSIISILSAILIWFITKKIL